MIEFPDQVCQRAIDDRDARFDGLLYVGIVTTRIYCRPTCPSRRANPDHRRFFSSAAAAEHAGFRPCLRCRPELAPGRTPIAAVSRLASTAAQRIAAGALNDCSVAELAAAGVTTLVATPAAQERAARTAALEALAEVVRSL